MVTALLEYLNLSTVFPEAYVDLILFVTILSISILAMQNRSSYSSQTPIFPIFHQFSRNFALCF